MIGLDKNCLSHSNTQNNEATAKAFKLACLTYKPSEVVFDNAKYSRKELISSKQQLMSYCLSKMRHLDLGTISSSALVNDDVNPRHIPVLPARSRREDDMSLLNFNKPEGGNPLRHSVKIPQGGHLDVPTKSSLFVDDVRLKSKSLFFPKDPSTDFESQRRQKLFMSPMHMHHASQRYNTISEDIGSQLGSVSSTVKLDQKTLMNVKLSQESLTARKPVGARANIQVKSLLELSDVTIGNPELPIINRRL